METKHTKGEWRFFNHENDTEVNHTNIRSTLIVCNDGDEHFKNHPWVIAEVQNNVISKNDGIENAKLIAAAPELLEALLQLKADIFVDGYSYRLSTMNKIDEAIKKATE